MKKVSAVLCGAGDRGGRVYGGYAINHPYELQFVAVAEPVAARRENFRKQHCLDPEQTFSSWEELVARGRLADTAFICTQDAMHYEPALQALELGYHVLLEKPMAVTPEHCIALGAASQRRGRLLSLCHVLRFTAFFTTIHRLVAEGRIGRLISIQHNENVGHWHQAHSFVRGNWRDAATASPMILAKSCHDMDILRWLAGASCDRISSFGSLTHFKKENAPSDAPARCLDGCPQEERCPYHAAKLYLTEDTGWPTSTISADLSLAGRIEALREGPYGRCIYQCDNNVVDHQVVNLEFANGVTAAFTMCAFTNEISRTIKLMGTAGEIRGAMEKQEIELIDFVTGQREVIHFKAQNGHGGGDEALTRDFVRLARQDAVAAGADSREGLSSARTAVESHLMAFAAEQARLAKRVVEMADFVGQFEKRQGDGAVLRPS